MTALPPNAENFRCEMGRYKLSRSAICDVIGMNPNLLTMFVNGSRTMPFWAAHNIGYGINRVTGVRVFDVEMASGLEQPRRKAKVSRYDARNGVRLPVPPRRRRRQPTY